MRTLIILGGSALALAVLVVIAGLLMPKTTEVERTTLIAVPVGRVFATVADVGRQSEWRTDIDRIELAGDGTSWIEHTKNGDRIAFRREESRMNERFGISYVSPRGFSGEWIGRFTVANDGTRLDVTERVTIPNPIVRLLGRVMAPPGSHTDLYLADLRKAMMAPPRAP